MELQRSNRELESYASVAAHDLKEPLRKIQTFGERIDSKCGEQMSPDCRSYLDRVRGSAHRMSTLIDDLLKLSRVASRAQPFVPVDLAEVAEDVVADSETYIEQVGGRVTIGDLVTIEADPTQMRQLLQNLIINGLKFSRADEPPAVRVGARLLDGDPGVGGAHAAADGWYEITVEDNGIGFDERYLDRIFIIFRRLHGYGRYDGTGVGLAICRRIAERHGGAITATSTPRKGSSFVVTLPVKQKRKDTDAA